MLHSLPVEFMVNTSIITQNGVHYHFQAAFTSGELEFQCIPIYPTCHA